MLGSAESYAGLDHCNPTYFSIQAACHRDTGQAVLSIYRTVALLNTPVYTPAQPASQSAVYPLTPGVRPRVAFAVLGQLSR